MTIRGLVEEGPESEDFIVRMTISFGPGFHSGKGLTRRQFAQKLREMAKKRPVSFLACMFEHHADHIEEAGAKYADGKYSLDAPANMEHILNAYFGEGSCDNCSVTHPGGSCCRCDYDGVSHCEPCG